MKVEDTPTGKQITLDSRWQAYWFIACCWWYDVPMTITWTPKVKR